MFMESTLFLLSLASHVYGASQATQSYSNSTSTALSSATTSVCCFVVQDTVSQEWFQMTSYSTTHSVVNLTSITTLITPYPNVTKTAYETHVYTTNATFNFTYPVGRNPITNFINDAPGPSQTTRVHENGTAVLTGGVTVTSPAAFYVYNTVKIITAAAVTDKHGQLMCGTTSSFPNGTVLPTFLNMNGNAQAYFGGPDIDGKTSIPVKTTTQTITNTFTYTSPPPSTKTTTHTFTETEREAFYTNKKGEIVTQTEKPSGVVISMVTPFIYQPERGAKGETGEGKACLQTGGTVNYGYVPQTLLDHLISNKQYSSQYPGLESCLPGGPSILQIKECSSVLPTFLQAGGDLTSSTVIFVTPPGATAVPVETPESKWSSTDTYPTTQEPATQLVPTNTWSSTDTYPTTQEPATELVPNPPQGTIPPTQNPPPGNTPPSSPNNPSPGNPPAQNPPPGNIPPSSPNNPSPGNPPAAPENALPLPAPQPTASLGIIINSIINPENANNQPTNAPAPVIISSPTTIPLAGAPEGLTGITTTISNTPFLIISSPTTIVPPLFPSTLGTTSTVNGIPVLIIPSATTLPASILPPGLGSTTLISNTPFVVVQPTTIPLPLPSSLVISGPTTIPVQSGFDISGSTTVINGVTNIVVSVPTTVPLKPTGTGGKNATEFVQASSAKGRSVEIWCFGVFLGLGIAVGILG